MGLMLGVVIAGVAIGAVLCAGGLLGGCGSLVGEIPSHPQGLVPWYSAGYGCRPGRQGLKGVKNPQSRRTSSNNGENIQRRQM